MDEQLLIDGCMRGESWARKELYEQYAPAMMSVCMRYVGDRMSRHRNKRSSANGLSR